MSTVLAVVVGFLVFALGLTFWPGSGAPRESPWRSALLMPSLVGALVLMGWWV